MAWATIAQVQELTDQTVTQPQIEMAQAIIELYAEATEDTDANISVRDLRNLKKAVAYQAVYMASNAHSDFFSRVDVKDLDQDGVKFAYQDRHGEVLSILAKRALEKLSWFGSGTIAVSGRTKAMSFSQWSAGMLTDEVAHPWHAM